MTEQTPSVSKTNFNAACIIVLLSPLVRNKRSDKRFNPDSAFSDVNLDGLTFYPGIDVVIADTEHQIGDPNGDGTVNILDVVAIVNYIQGTGDLEFVVAADTNLDGTINILDIVVIINYILGTGDLG